MRDFTRVTGSHSIQNKENKLHKFNFFRIKIPMSKRLRKKCSCSSFELPLVEGLLKIKVANRIIFMLKYS